MRRRSSRRLAIVPVLALLAAFATACQDEAEPEPAPTGGDVELSFGVFGNDAVVAAYQSMVDSYNATAQSVQVDLVSWPSSDAMTTDLVNGVEKPDVYLVARRDLAGVIEGERNVPLFDLLAERNISYGDDYALPAIEAFSADDDLQCMPSTVSPMVIYYNTDLVDFDAMREQGLAAPSDELEGWTFDEFSAAAEFASRRGDDRGVSISPTLASLAPFLLSGGGALYDDGGNPTSVAFSSSDNLDTLDTVLPLLRDTQYTLSEEQLAEATPLEWFERGQVGMIEGFRDLVPELREVDGLDFDVMPMPEVGGPATVGEVSGLCIAPGDHVQQAADFLVHVISDESVEALAETGEVVPANLTVARSDAFLQPGQQPEHAGVFNASVDNLVLLPLVDDVPALNQAVEPLLTDLLLTPGVINVADLAGEIDEASRSVLDPDYTPSPSESDSPTS
ncbi:ABC transporter substrate-binding protein [Nocardioides sp.]|uniref:ABC transporter substrate-binding protein n=1 Tax=Nocardioides sp. TaxID=35761 RepID=UPI00271C3C55|nr:extracellular solute-binding protein [Nocardioides sp.]MDO9456861.1 extracellular solute-binding protein [Nocardioides sp.]